MIENPDIKLCPQDDETMVFVEAVSQKAMEVIDNDQALQVSLEGTDIDPYFFPYQKKDAIDILTWAISHNLSLEANGVPMIIKTKKTNSPS